MMKIFNQNAPEKGSLIVLKSSGELYDLTEEFLETWSKLYDFPIIKIGKTKFLYEADLNTGLQKHIEVQTRKSFERRAKVKNLILERREAFEAWKQRKKQRKEEQFKCEKGGESS